MTAAVTPTTTAERFMDLLANRDFAAIELLLAPDVRFRGLTPSNTFAHIGPAAAVPTLQRWFGSPTSFEPQTLGSDTIGPVTHLVYRFTALKAGKPTVVEQHAYVWTEGERIADIAIICSGYQPAAGIDAPLAS